MFCRENLQIRALRKLWGILLRSTKASQPLPPWWGKEWGWKIRLIRLLLAGVDRSLDNQSDRLHQRMQGKAEMAADWQRKLGLFWSYATGRSNAMYWCCCLVLPHKEHMAWPHKATSMPTPQQSQTRKKISWGYWYQDIDLTIVIFWNLHYK